MVTDIEIRSAVRADLPVIVALLRDDEFGRARETIDPEDLEPYSAAFLEIQRDLNSDVLVAVADGAVVGCLQITCIPGLSYQGVRRGLIEDVRVARHLRGYGIGKRLVTAAERHAQSVGCALLELFVHQERTEAQSFYESLAFEGHHRGYRKSLTF